MRGAGTWTAVRGPSSRLPDEGLGRGERLVCFSSCTCERPGPKQTADVRAPEVTLGHPGKNRGSRAPCWSGNFTAIPACADLGVSGCRRGQLISPGGSARQRRLRPSRCRSRSRRRVPDLQGLTGREALGPDFRVQRLRPLFLHERNMWGSLRCFLYGEIAVSSVLSQINAGLIQPHLSTVGMVGTHSIQTCTDVH